MKMSRNQGGALFLALPLPAARTRVSLLPPTATDTQTITAIITIITTILLRSDVYGTGILLVMSMVEWLRAREVEDEQQRRDDDPLRRAIGKATRVFLQSRWKKLVVKYAARSHLPLPAAQ